MTVPTKAILFEKKNTLIVKSVDISIYIDTTSLRVLDIFVKYLLKKMTYICLIIWECFFLNYSQCINKNMCTYKAIVKGTLQIVIFIHVVAYITER